MTIKAALITALSLALFQPTVAASVYAQSSEHLPSSAAASDPEITGALPASSRANPRAHPDIILLDPSSPTAGDIVGGHGPNPYMRELKQIAIYASIGNKEGVAMLVNQLRERGVSREAIRGAISRINVHGEAFTAPTLHPRSALPNAGAGWEASQ